MYKLFILLILILILPSCDEKVTNEKKKPLSNGVENVILSDVNNNGNGSDLRVSFTGVVDESQVNEYRIIIHSNQSDDELTVENAALIESANYTAVPKKNKDYSITLDEATRDIEGQLITNDIEYSAYVFTDIKKSYSDSNFLSPASNKIFLENKTGLTSNIFADDIKNDQNESDILISFDKAIDEELVKEYRIYIINKSNISILETPRSILNREDIKYRTVEISEEESEEETDKKVTLYLNSSDVDISDTAIELNADYLVVVGTIADGILTTTNVLNTEYAEFNISINNYIETFVERVESGSGGLSMHSNGTLYMSDIGVSLSSFEGNKIYSFDEDGNATTWVDELNGPVGSSFDNNGNLYVANYSANNIIKIDADANVQNYGFNRPSADKPMDVYFNNADSTVYFTNSGNNKIYKIGKDLETIVFYENDDNLLNGANGIARDLNGNFYISNFGNGNIIKIDTDGNASIFANLLSFSLGQIIYANGAIYVAARDVHKIYRIDLNGQIKQLAGSGNSGSSNGSALKSDLNLPFGLAMSPDGKYLYFNVVVKQLVTVSLQPSMIKRIVLDEVVNQ